MFQPTLRPEERSDEGSARVGRCHDVSTHAPPRRAERRPARAHLLEGPAVSTHAPPRRAERHLASPVKPSAASRSFNPRSAPKSGATPTGAATSPGAGSFNPRSAPKSGATPPRCTWGHHADVSTHAPPRRAERQRDAGPLCATKRGFNPRSAPKSGATFGASIRSAPGTFQPTLRPEERSDSSGDEGRGLTRFQPTLRPEERSDSAVMKTRFWPLRVFQPTLRPEERSD